MAEDKLPESKCEQELPSKNVRYFGIAHMGYPGAVTATAHNKLLHRDLEAAIYQTQSAIIRFFWDKRVFDEIDLQLGGWNPNATVNARLLKMKAMLDQGLTAKGVGVYTCCENYYRIDGDSVEQVAQGAWGTVRPTKITESLGSVRPTKITESLGTVLPTKITESLGTVGVKDV